MITRICISLNNACNLNCTYCHFHTEEKKAVTHPVDMDVQHILSIYRNYINKHEIGKFTIGYVGNGEPLLSYALLKKCVEYTTDLEEKGVLNAYTVTNGTLLTEEKSAFFEKHHMKVGISLDGPKWLHDSVRCLSFDRAMQGAESYKQVTGRYPRFNATVGRASIKHADEIINFFMKFGSKITFSRMIGEGGISLDEYHQFMKTASKYMPVHTGGYDCTMYGGLCGAGMDNLYYANAKIWICGNCIDLPAIGDYKMNPDLIKPMAINAFDRRYCYHDLVQEGVL